MLPDVKAYPSTVTVPPADMLEGETQTPKIPFPAESPAQEEMVVVERVLVVEVELLEVLDDEELPVEGVNSMTLLL